MDLYPVDGTNLLLINLLTKPQEKKVRLGF